MELDNYNRIFDSKRREDIPATARDFSVRL